MGQIHCPLWVTWKDPVGSRSKLWKSVGGWSLYADGHKRYRLAHTTHRPMVNVRDSIPPWLACWEHYPQRRNQSEWNSHIGMPVHAYNCTQNSVTGFSPYYLMHGRQPHFPVDVTLGLASHTTMAPNTSKFVQKMRECMKWAHKKAETFQVKEAQCHRQNDDERSKAVAVEVGDMVLVCVTAFKGHHKIQDHWENREYVVERWSYPDVPIYVVCPMDGEGHSQTLGVENTNTSTPVPPVDSESTDAGPSGMVMSSIAGNTSQGCPDQPAPLRCGMQMTQNQFLWRYQNFGLQADTRPPDIWGVWAGLHVISGLYTIFWGSTG